MNEIALPLGDPATQNFFHYDTIFAVNTEDTGCETDPPTSGQLDIGKNKQEWFLVTKQERQDHFPELTDFGDKTLASQYQITANNNHVHSDKASYHNESILALSTSNVPGQYELVLKASSEV